MVTVIVQDAQGEEVLRYKANPEDTIIEQAEANGVDIPFACRAGACLSCVATVKEGMEHLMQNMKGDKLIETDEDQFLTCIGGVKPASCYAEEEYQIVLEVLM